MARHPRNRRGVSRRQVLRSGAAALGGRAALLAGASSLITKRYTLADSRQAVQDTADRTIITGVIEFA
jgi:hypothetical protein